MAAPVIFKLLLGRALVDGRICRTRDDIGALIAGQRDDFEHES